MTKRSVTVRRERLLDQRMPTPRKLPAQSRSRALVDAVTQACLRILDEEGADVLTINRIAEVSGATVGSIYQYFPNKEAIVAFVYDQILTEETEHLLRVRERVEGVPLATALREILANSIRVERRLFLLDREFHLRYHAELQLGMRTGEYADVHHYIEATWLPYLARYASDITTPHLTMAAYLLGKGLRSMVRAVLEDDPAQLESPALLDSLVAMAMGCLRPA